MNFFAESLLEVASETESPTSRWKLLQNFTSQFKTQNLTSQFRTQREREKVFVLCVGVFQLRIRSAIYSAPGGANRFEPNE